MKIRITLIFVLGLSICSQLSAQDSKSSFSTDSLKAAAKEMMLQARFCALITTDPYCFPSARMMDAFAPDDSLIVWFGTNRESRKISEIKANNKVSIYYSAKENSGYVLIKGIAEIVDDSESKKKMWKEAWTEFYPEDRSNYLLVKVVPLKLEIVDYTHGITSKSATWEAPYLNF